MISPKMEEALNQQINEEWYSAYLYLSMSAYCAGLDLPGVANWFRVQHQEEMFHANKLYDYVLEQGSKAKLLQIKEPEREFGSLVEVFEAVLKHEQFITGCIYKLADLAQDERDHATNMMLQWFVAEQVEEESTAADLLAKVKRIGDDGHGLLMIDQELGARVFTPPAAE